MVTGQRPSILFIDIQEENFRLLMRVLSAEQFDLVHSKSGKDAIKIAKDKNFALILLEVQMPEQAAGFGWLDATQNKRRCLSLGHRCWQQRPAQFFMEE